MHQDPSNILKGVQQKNCSPILHEGINKQTVVTLPEEFKETYNRNARPINPKHSHRSCIEKDHNPDTLKRLTEAVRFKKELEQKDYSDLSISDAEQLFKEKKYHDAVRHYPEAIKRNPEDLGARPFLIILCASAYDNQAVCYTKLTSSSKGGISEKKRDVKIVIKTILDVDLIEVKGDRRKFVLFNAGRVAKGLRHLDEKYGKERWEILSSVVELLCYAANVEQHSRGGEPLTSFIFKRVTWNNSLWSVWFKF
ncbi:hypothetical protein YC2023_051510 [Brassica napus]